MDKKHDILVGGGRFRKVKNLIKILVVLHSYLPFKVNIILYNSVRPVRGYLGILLRYVLIKNLAKYCGDNVIIKENVYIYNIAKLSVGNNVSIHPMCYVDCKGGIQIGNNVSIAHATTILSTSHTYGNLDIPIKYNPCISEATVIDDDVWIGCGVRVISGVHIAKRCIIGAGSVLNKDTEEKHIYAGVPAKKVKSINNFK